MKEKSVFVLFMLMNRIDVIYSLTEAGDAKVLLLLMRGGDNACIVTIRFHVPNLNIYRSIFKWMYICFLL